MSSSRSAERSLLQARLLAQGLSGEPAADVVVATRRLLAVQAQDPRATRLALRVRTAGGHASAVDQALNDGSLIITWVNRGTLHLVAAEDEPLLHALTTPQLRRSSDRRLADEGVSPAAAKRAIAAIVKALAADGPMTRAELRAVLERARLPTAGQATTHILFSATLDGLIVRGPMTGGEHAFALAADWLGERPHIELDHALAELARRYLAGHGPADQHDLAKWAQLPVRDARAAFNAIAPELEQRPDGLVELKSRAGEETPLPPPRLLGPFDPLLLGWRSGAFILDDPPEVVTVNGIIRAIALVKGRAAGTWTMPGGRVELRLWGRQSRVTTTALERDAAAVEAYLAADLTSRHPRAGTVRRRYGWPKPERARHDPLL
jgi:Winged helix DNA-binding domain